MNSVPHTPRVLALRAQYLLQRSSLPGRSQMVQAFLERFQRVGRIGLIGGAVRDLAYMSARRFKSDLDFVVEVHDHALFNRLLDQLTVRRNAFGGYRLSLPRLHVDFWDARQSWAAKEGLVAVSKLEDVLATTFFNIDALIYVVGESRLIAREGALEALAARTLDINLERNPNPLGATVRALRRMKQFDLRATPALQTYIANNIAISGWRAIVKRDGSAYPHSPFLRTLFDHVPDADEFLQLLAQHDGRLPCPRQTDLFAGRSGHIAAASGPAVRRTADAN